MGDRPASHGGSPGAAHPGGRARAQETRGTRAEPARPRAPSGVRGVVRPPRHRTRPRACAERIAEPPSRAILPSRRPSARAARSGGMSGGRRRRASSAPTPGPRPALRAQAPPGGGVHARVAPTGAWHASMRPPARRGGLRPPTASLDPGPAIRSKRRRARGPVGTRRPGSHETGCPRPRAPAPGRPPRLDRAGARPRGGAPRKPIG